MIFKMLMAGHIFGDFYFQTNQLAAEKKHRLKGLFLHCCIYYISVSGCVLLVEEKGMWLRALTGIFIVTILHGIQDFAKNRLEGRLVNHKKYGHILFLLDQAMHLLLLYVVVRLCGIRVADGCVLSELVDMERMKDYVSPVLAALICWKPSSIFIALVFDTIPNIIVSTGEVPMVETAESRKKEESLNVGALIGILEREIILILGFMNQFGAIGFVLTAKSLARYKQLENRAFAEKYLVGTLLSVIISIICIGVGGMT